MFDFINQLAISPVQAILIYAAAGLFLFHGDKRIRWYIMSIAWVSTGMFDRGFLIETAMLGFAFLLVEDFYLMYANNFSAKREASEDKKI